MRFFYTMGMLLGMLFLCGMFLNCSSEIVYANLLEDVDYQSHFQLRPEYKMIDDTFNEKTMNMSYRFRASQQVLDWLRWDMSIATIAGSNRSIQTDPNTDGIAFRLEALSVTAKFEDSGDAGGIAVTLGRMKNPLLKASSALWDSDIRLSGGHVRYTRPWRGIEVSVSAGLFQLEQRSPDNTDHTTGVIQAGVTHVFPDKAQVKVGISRYVFSNIPGSRLDYSSNTNSRVDDRLVYGYEPWVFSQVYTTPLKHDHVEYIGVYSDWIYNSAAPEDRFGFILGIKFGDPVLAKFGDWQIQCDYRDIQRDAWLDSLPDGSAYNGRTNIKGTYVGYSMALSSQWRWAARLYQMDVSKGASNPYHLTQIQVDYMISSAAAKK